MNTNGIFAWEIELSQILSDYKQGDTDPLDGDEVEDLVDLLRDKLNLIEGNITIEEYFMK